MSRAALAITCGAALASACGDSGPSTPIITVTSPTGFGELVPTRTLAIAWTVDGTFDRATTSVALRSREDQAIVLIVDHGIGATGTFAPTATGFTWGGRGVATEAALPIGYYDITVDTGAGPIDAGDTHVVVVQGLAFTQPAPGGAALVVSQAAPADLDFTTSTVSSLDVTLEATPTTGPAVTIKDVPVPGELRTVGRTITWDATDASGAAVPSGDYTLGASVTDSAHQVTYLAAGGVVHVP